MAGGRLYQAALATPDSAPVGGRLYQAAVDAPTASASGRLYQAFVTTPTLSGGAAPGGRLYQAAVDAPQPSGAGGRLYHAQVAIQGITDLTNVFLVVNGVKRRVVAMRQVQGLTPHRIDTIKAAVTSGTTVQLRDVHPVLSTPPPPPPPPPVPIAAPLKAVLDMIGGLGSGALWGFYANASGGTYEGNYRSVEQPSGRQFDITYRYYDVSLKGPDAQQMNLVNEGRIPHLAFTPRTYSGSYDTSLLPAPAGRDKAGTLNGCWLYSQMYDGSMDKWLKALATRLKTVLGTTKPYFLNFNEEPEGQIDYRVSMFSDPNYYKSAGAGMDTTFTQHKWDVLHEYSRAASYWTNFLKAEGVTNAIHVLCYANGRRADYEHQALYYPECDVIAWDPYDGTDPYSRFLEFNSRIDKGLFDPVDTAAKTKPRGISEWGTIGSGAGIQPDYILQVPGAMKKLPKMIFVQQFSSGVSSIVGNQAAVDAFGAASRDPYVNRRA